MNKVIPTLAVLFLSAPNGFCEVAAPPTALNVPFKVTIHADKTKYLGGEFIPMKIEIQDLGKENLTLPGYSPEFLFDFSVIGPDKRETPKMASGFLRRGWASESLSVSTLKPTTGTVWLNNIFDMSQPGHYTISVSRKTEPKPGEKPVTVTSNTLEIDVTSQPPTSNWN